MCLQLSAWKNENGSWRSSTPQRGASSCRGVPTARPCWVLDGGCTLGADAHDLLLSVQTRSFITHNLESLFYSAWAPMLLLSLEKIWEKKWKECTLVSGEGKQNNPGFLRFTSTVIKTISCSQMCFDFFCLLHLLYNETLFGCTLRQEAITPKAHFCCLEQSGLFMMWEVYSS